MPFDLALVDLFRPYLLRGEATQWHAVLSVIYVESYETAMSPDGMVIRGVARFSGNIDPPTYDPNTGVLSAGAGNIEGHPRTQPDRREPWLDITDTKVEFAMTVPHATGAIITTGAATIPGTDAGFQALNQVFNVWQAAVPSAYPNTGFTLDLVLSGIEIRAPFLYPAKMQDDGLLVSDPAFPDVVLHMPRIKLRVDQGSGMNAAVNVDFASLGVAGLDDPGDMAALEMIRMEPAYAFIGTGQVVGFAFRSAVLDLADGYTPPEILDQFGFDESWTGLYLPEIRIFFAPNGAEDFAVNAGVENLLIGLGNSSGITGDFDLAVINQGDGDMTVSARFFDSDGRAIGVKPLTDTAAEVHVPAQTRMIIDVVGGRAPYSASAQIGGVNQAGIVHDVTATATPEPIAITATDTSSTPKQANLTITVRLREEQPSQPPPGLTPPLGAELETTSITLDGQSRAAPELRLLSDTGAGVIIGIAGHANPATAWDVDGASEGSSASVGFDLAGGESKSIRATIPGDTISALTGYFRFDKPPKTGAITYSIDPQNTSAEQAVDPSSSAPWKPPARQFLAAYGDIFSRITPKTIDIEGTASHDGDDHKAKYNYLLSQRRSLGLAALINSQFPGFSVNNGPTGVPNAAPPDIAAGATPPPVWVANWKTQGNPREQWWKATVTGFTVALPGPVIEGTIQRRAVPEPPVPPVIVDPTPDTPPPPDWFRSARLKVRIVQDQFVALELSGAVDFETAVEGKLRNNGGNSFPSIRGLGNNPADGIVDYLFLYQTDPASQTDEVKLYIGADPNDRDGLVMTGQLPGQALEDPNTGRNILGMTTLFTPLLAEIAPANPADGGIAPIVLSAAVVALPSALAEIEVGGERLLNIERVVLYGGEAVFRRQGERWETSFLFDVETAISAKISIGGFDLLTIPRESPLSVRYKAIGLKFGYPPGSSAAWELRPVFDQSKGYTIDVSGPGVIQLPDPLGNLLQVLGARIARTNPLNFEIDLGFSVDLGVISVERARVRMPLDPVGPPELTAFAAGMKVPGVIEGKGYMEISNNAQTDGMEIKGGLDVSLIPIKFRVAAQIAVAQIGAAAGGPATGVAVALEVELPVAIPLAQSGFGIYGFLGLFAMHYKRDEDGITSLTPALTWLKDRAEGDPTNLRAWKPSLGSWAFGVGITLGTMGSPIIFNVKGMFLLELPGPRILLVVKANLLAVLPDLKDKDAEGTFLCVIDLDIGRKTLTIGLSIDFSITPIVEIKIPVEAYFNLDKGGDWHVYLGTFPGLDSFNRPMPGPIRIKILEVFDGSGYVMISGHGIPSYSPGGNLPSLPSVTGTALAVGLEVSIVWGNTSINLYLRVTAGFNALLGFEPFYVGGVLYIRGELKLFIISLSASASLVAQFGEKIELIGDTEIRTQISRIDGEVCGELDLFFFTLKGCVDFHIGEENKILPPGPKLVTATSLVSRSPALAFGTGTDRGIDSKIGDAVARITEPPHNPATEGHPETTNTMPVVPIDAIPVISMAMAPVDDALTIFGDAPLGSPGGADDGFIKRGDFEYRYDLIEVRLETADGEPPISTGNAPSVWWTQNSPVDDNLSAQLALLNWIPNPSPKALERTEFLEETVKDRWGSICNDAAPAAPVLWTFHDEPLGPSESGWRVKGIAWPDPAGTSRSAEPELELHIFETWRTGERTLDRNRGIIPAVIEGGKIPCFPFDKLDNGDDVEPTNPTRPGLQPGDLTLLNPGLNIPISNLSDIFADSFLAANPFTAANPRLTRARPTPARTTHPTGRLSAVVGALTRGNPTIATPFRNRLARERGRLARATERSFGHRKSDTLDVPTLRIDAAIKRLHLGQIVNRASILNAASGMTTAGQASSANGAIGVAATVGPFDGDWQCEGRLLTSPLWDVGFPVVFGDKSKSDQIASELALLGHEHGPLSDVLRIDSGAIIDGKILLWVNGRLLNKKTSKRGMMIHYLDKDNNVLGTRPVRNDDKIGLATTPDMTDWADVTGPWFEDVFQVFAHGTLSLPNRERVLVPLDPPNGTVKIDLGVLHTSDRLMRVWEEQGRPYYVGAIELTQLGEKSRSEWDETQITRDREVVESFLGPASADVALLHPGTTYKVTTVANTKVRFHDGEQDGNPLVTQDGNPQQEVFWFRTDDDAPKRLDPWVLCSLPAAEEEHVFGHEELKIVFATNDIDKLYAAYGKELRARLKAASFRQVDEPGVQHPNPINPTTLDNVKAYALSPFEDVLVDIIGENAPCINVDEERVRHSALTIPIPLDPFTDYVLDVESVDIGAPLATIGDRVLRRSFSTGGFASLENFVDDFAATLTEHRAVAPGVMQAIGTQFASNAPIGAEFDQAFIDAGLEPMPVPDAPRIIVFWEQANADATPRPAAVMLDASEPMQRMRELPKKVTTDDDTPVTRLEMVAQEWLTLDEAASGDNIVHRVVFAPGQQRALLTFKPNARGKVMHIDLIRRGFDAPYLDGPGASDTGLRIVSETLRHAPWEEE